MNKKVKIIICVILIICAICFIGVIVRKKLNKKDNSVIEPIQNKDTIVFEDKMSGFEELLTEEGIELTDKEAITSEVLNENGYKYTYNGEQIELYNISQAKMENLIHKQYSEYEFIILTQNHEKVEVIYYDEILILNCIKNHEELINTLKKLV